MRKSSTYKAIIKSHNKTLSDNKSKYIMNSDILKHSWGDDWEQEGTVQGFNQAVSVPHIPQSFLNSLSIIFFFCEQTSSQKWPENASVDSMVFLNLASLVVALSQEAQ